MNSNKNNFIKRLKKGKEDALEYVVDEYIQIVKGIILKILKTINNQMIIEECINDVFLAVWNNSNQFSGDEVDFKKWICTIAKFKAIDYYRKEVKSFEIKLNEDITYNNICLEDEILISEEKNILLNEISLMNDIDKKIFIMKFFLGIKSENIALKLNLSKASVDNRISRGKKKLKKKIDIYRLEVL